MYRKSTGEVKAAAIAELQFDQLELGQALSLHGLRRDCSDIAIALWNRSKDRFSSSKMNAAI